MSLTARVRPPARRSSWTVVDLPFAARNRATPLISSRVRFCVSAAHTKQDIDLILRACDEVGDVLDLKHGKGRWTVDEVIRRAEELVAAD